MRKTTKKLTAIISTIACVAALGSVSVSALAPTSLDVDAKNVASVSNSSTVISFIDNTPEQWTANDGAKMVIIDNDNYHANYEMQKTYTADGRIEWKATAALEQGHNFTFKRYVGSNLCNTWEAGKAGSYRDNAFVVTSADNGQWQAYSSRVSALSVSAPIVVEKGDFEGVEYTLYRVDSGYMLSLNGANSGVMVESSIFEEKGELENVKYTLYSNGDFFLQTLSEDSGMFVSI